MANYTTENHNSVPFLLGDNEFRTGLLTVPASTTYKVGTIVQTVDGKFVASAGGSDEVGVGVIVDDEVNESVNPANVSIRVLISGKVNESFLKVGDNKATAVQADALRKWGIVALKVNELN